MSKAGSPFAYGETSAQNELEVSPCKWGLSVVLGQDKIQLPISRLLRYTGNTVDQFFSHPTAHRGPLCRSCGLISDICTYQIIMKQSE